MVQPFTQPKVTTMSDAPNDQITDQALVPEHIVRETVAFFRRADEEARERRERREREAAERQEEERKRQERQAASLRDLVSRM
jgi:hypothetical protein